MVTRMRFRARCAMAAGMLLVGSAALACARLGLDRHLVGERSAGLDARLSVRPIGLPRSLCDADDPPNRPRTSVGGHKVRIVLSNEYGDAPLPIAAAHVAMSDGGGEDQSRQRPRADFRRQGRSDDPARRAR